MAVKVVQATDVASLIAEIRKALCRFGTVRYLFRGHSDASWELVPSVHRSYDNEGERLLLGRFRLGGSSRRPDAPHLTDMATWLCLAQHYGLPTRLLDWTHSLAIAAYFAVGFEHSATDAAIWILSGSELNKRSSKREASTFLLGGDESLPLLREAFDGVKCVDDVIAVAPAEVDVRLAVQSGSFTIHSSPQPLETRPEAEQFLLKIVIPAASRKTLEEELWVLGMSRSTLFPDLANLATELRVDERIVPKRPVHGQ